MTKNNNKFDNESEADYNHEEDIVLEEHSVNDSLKKLREKLKICISEKQEYLGGWQRTKADFVNFKKGEETRRKDLIKFSKEDFIENILPVLDSLNMALDSDSGNDGMEQIKGQLEGILKKEGVEEMNPMGGDFDPNLHEAIEVVDGREGEVIEVVQKGYSLNGKIIRPARVKVGK
jgi:molecular chaperone GrpE